MYTYIHVYIYIHVDIHIYIYMYIYICVCAWQRPMNSCQGQNDEVYHPGIGSNTLGSLIYVYDIYIYMY